MDDLPAAELTLAALERLLPGFDPAVQALDHAALAARMGEAAYVKRLRLECQRHRRNRRAGTRARELEPIDSWVDDTERGGDRAGTRAREGEPDDTSVDDSGLNSRRARARAGTLERLLPPDPVIRLVFRLSGLQWLGSVFARRIEVTRHTFVLEGLPPAFDGVRILHLSDLHGDLFPEIGPLARDIISGLDYDLCVFTGDFWDNPSRNGPKGQAVVETVLGAVKAPLYGIFGNHDSLRVLGSLEAMGVRMLLNESCPIEVGGDTLWLTGVDDSYYYGTDDLAHAMRGVPTDAFKVLLAHNPDNLLEAAPAGYALQLSGHTHGGQVCLPGGYPIIAHCKVDRRFARGPWQHGSMAGYTSRGIGSGAVPARYFCPPEIAVHTLRAR